MRLDIFHGAGGRHIASGAENARPQSDFDGDVLIGSDGLSYVATVETTRAGAEAVVYQMDKLGDGAWDDFVESARSA
ncbi:hypothetical protein RWH45_06565 [Microbacterium sp. KSW4-17]|uniref:Uncharacterized protein n=1 Tax=Microbacterium galbum TaxID=3075994 RepID=A0ABU3T679_9MICO|nr:hypothetical protein [Microbacterium sp. KSW4-17]MDU0366872.1 hypothetical protein [Microbacterium sp. KSW4-17]